MNNLSFWLLPVAFTILLSTAFMEGGLPGFGWTFYAPLSTNYPNVAFFVFAVHIMGISSIMGSINVIVTIMNMRAPGMTLMKMPLFVWSWLITAYLLIAVMPVLAGAVTMLLMDAYFGTSFFDAAGGGDPVLFQHIFWFFGHPGDQRTRICAGIILDHHHLQHRKTKCQNKHPLATLLLLLLTQASQR